VDTFESATDGRRRRRQHSAEFKAQVVAACRRTGVSIAAVALQHRLNANLVRRWVVEAERVQGVALVAARNSEVEVASAPDAGFVPITLQRAAVVGSPHEIAIELRRGATLIKVNWPLTAAAECAAWLGQLLR
jgi:transposase-like protein